MSASYWNETFSRRDCASMNAKYGALTAALGERDGERKRQLLRAAACEWPGALREAQMTMPARFHQRTLAVSERVEQRARSRSYWRTHGLDDITLWFDLHDMTRDVMSFRSSPSARTVDAFSSWLARRACERWTGLSSDTLQILCETDFHIRGVYRCLAARAGLDYPTLVYRLFARSDLTQGG